MSSPVDRQKVLQGIKYSLLSELVLGVFLSIIWLIAIGTLSTFPIGLFTLASGGLLLTIAGCIGPGRYQREYDLLIYTPRPGSSFSDEFEVSGFVIDKSIRKATVMVNNQEAGTILFNDQGIGRLTLSRRDFISSTINSIYLQAGEIKSNVNDFTVFDYSDDMTEEEIDELYQMETADPEKSLTEAMDSYMVRVQSRIGSVIVGVSIVGIVNLITGFLLDSLLGLTF